MDSLDALRARSDHLRSLKAERDQLTGRLQAQRTSGATLNNETVVDVALLLSLDLQLLTAAIEENCS